MLAHRGAEQRAKVRSRMQLGLGLGLLCSVRLSPPTGRVLVAWGVLKGS